MRTFKGVWPAIVTPFGARGGVDEKVARGFVDYLLARGVEGFYVCGSTGQGPVMSVAERKQMTTAVIEQVAGRVPVIAQVGALAIPDAVDLAHHARDAGAAAVSSWIPPIYADAESLCAYYTALAAAVPDLPMLPYVSGGAVSPLALIKRLAPIPNLGGTKYTGPNMFELKAVVDLRASDWSIFSGMDEQCVYGAQAGAHGCIGSTMNVMPGIYKRIRAHVVAGQLAPALELQARANRVTATMIAAGYDGALREAIGVLGFDCGDPRLPGKRMDAAARKALRADLAKVGFEEIAAM
jgi:N-acetylneuraminate lyase